MKKIKTIYSITFAVICCLAGSASQAAKSGPITSGGGMGVACADKQGQILNVELLDLYEAKNRYQLGLVSSSGNTEQDYIDAVKRTYKQQGADLLLTVDEIRKSYRNFFKRVKWTGPGQHLPFLNDQGQTLPLPAQCQLVQIAIFHDSKIEKIDIDSDYWNMLSPLNQAALLEHELVYKYERVLLEQTSESTRAMVAHLFTVDATPVLQGVPADALTCVADAGSGKNLSTFQVYATVDENLQTHITLQLTQIMGRPLINKTVIHALNTNFVLSSFEDGLIVGNDLYKTVAEVGANVHARFPVNGGHGEELVVGIDYEYAKPIKLSLFKKGLLIGENLVQTCFR